MPSETVPSTSEADVAVDRPIAVLDLFAGAGGLTEGLHRASSRFRTVQAVELDPAAAATFRANHDGAVHVGSIEDWLETASVPEVDLIIGGPPCQGFSTLGKQDVEDKRNVLWQEYASTIVKAKPKYFIVENVAAFLRSPQLTHFRNETELDGELADYSFRATVLNAADYGAPQARKRAVLIGHHRDLPFPGWPAPTHAGRHETVRRALKDVTWACSGADLPDRFHHEDGRTLPGRFRTGELHLSRSYSRTSMQRICRIPPGGNRFDIPSDLLPDCWRKHKTGSADVMGRLHWDRPSVTIRTEFFKPEKGRYLHPEANRALTHLEAALLQGFRRSYRWVGSKTAIARQIGNAVPIPLGSALGRQLLAAIDA